MNFSKLLKKHWATKKGRASIIALVLLFITLSYSIISFLVILTSNVSNHSYVNKVAHSTPLDANQTK